MPTTGPENLTLKDRKRCDILNASILEFLKRGFDNTSMDQIAASAAVSKRTLYNHFPSKDDLFETIVAELVSEFEKMPEYQFDPNKKIERQLADIGYQICESLQNEVFMKLARIVVARLITAPEFTSVLSERTQHVDKEMTDWFAEAKRSKKLRITDPAIAASEFLNILMGYAFWPKLIGLEKPMHKLEAKAFTKKVAKMFLATYGIQD